MRPLPQIAALFALVALLAGGPAGAAGGTRLLLPVVHSPATIVYESDRDSGLSIVEASGDGTVQRTLSGPDTNSWNPVPSPDGRQIAFFSTRDGHNAAYVMARDGTAPRRVADCNLCAGMVWSPDSRLLWVAVRERDTTWYGNGLVTMRVEVEAATSVKLPAFCHALIPDGSRCAYGEPAGGGRFDLLVRSPATAEPVAVARLDHYPSWLAWSPDGALLLYENTDDFGLYVVGLDGRPPRRIAGGQEPFWSPDGHEIAFIGSDAASGMSVLKVLDVQSGAERTVAADAAAILGWSPDGDQLAFSRGEGWQLSLVGSAGGQPARVLPIKVMDSVVWSPDSGRLAALSPGAGAEQQSLYVVDRDGGTLALGPAKGFAWAADGRSLIFTVEVTAPLRLYAQSPGEPAGRAIAEGTWPDLGAGMVAFVRDGGLYVVGLDGAGERRLAGSLQIIAPPSWSPDGRQLAIAAKEGESASIYVLAPGGWSPRPVAGCDGPSCGRPLWSPDGAKLLFTRRDGIVSVPAGGGEQRELARGGEPVWSPDGTRIAYVFFNRIYTMGAGGGEAEEVSVCDNLTCSQLAWSPDGRQLSYQTESYGVSRVNVISVENFGRMDASIHGAEAARWWGWGFAYLYQDIYAALDVNRGPQTWSYRKVCLADAPGGRCEPIPRGHGNVVMYDIAP